MGETGGLPAVAGGEEDRGPPAPALAARSSLLLSALVGPPQGQPRERPACGRPSLGALFFGRGPSRAAAAGARHGAPPAPRFGGAREAQRARSAPFFRRGAAPQVAAQRRGTSPVDSPRALRRPGPRVPHSCGVAEFEHHAASTTTEVVTLQWRSRVALRIFHGRLDPALSSPRNTESFVQRRERERSLFVGKCASKAGARPPVSVCQSSARWVK